MKLAILIVNFKTPDLTLACVESVIEQLRTIGDSRAFVVDNGSGDNSAKLIHERIEHENWSDVITLIESKENLGFAGGNNLAYEHAHEAEYVLLLNSDTIAHQNCLTYCLNKMQRESSLGALSCLLLNEDGSAQTAARRFPTLTRELVKLTGLPYRLPSLFGWADTEDLAWDRKTMARDVEWIGGAFMFCRGDLLRNIGLLDDSFFFYGEDVEFCYRIQNAGCRIAYDPAVSILHLGGGSSDPDRISETRRRASTWRARYQVMNKCSGPLAEWILRRADRLKWTLRRLRLKLSGKREAYRDANDVCTLLASGILE